MEGLAFGSTLRLSGKSYLQPTTCYLLLAAAAICIAVATADITTAAAAAVTATAMAAARTTTSATTTTSIGTTIAITVAITILIAIYDCHFGARRAPTIAIAIHSLSAAFFCTSRSYLAFSYLHLLSVACYVGCECRLRNVGRSDEATPSLFGESKNGFSDRSGG